MQEIGIEKSCQLHLVERSDVKQWSTGADTLLQTVKDVFAMLLVKQLILYLLWKIRLLP